VQKYHQSRAKLQELFICVNLRPAFFTCDWRLRIIHPDSRPPAPHRFAVPLIRFSKFMVAPSTVGITPKYLNMPIGIGGGAVGDDSSK
jgi:hypothetical protein